MAKVYDKDGEEYNVPFAIDVADWLSTGSYSLSKPEEKKNRKNKEDKTEGGE